MATIKITIEIDTQDPENIRIEKNPLHLGRIFDTLEEDPTKGLRTKPIKKESATKLPEEKPFTTPDPKKSKWNPKKAKDRLCAKCGKIFQPSGPRQKYCSEECGLKPKPKGEKPKPPKIRHINEGREKSETVSSDAIFQRTCQYCGETFATMDRSDKFCGAKCEHFFKKQAKK